MVKTIRLKIKSDIFLLLLSVIIIYTVSLIWTILHHLSWWIITGKGKLVLEYSVYPIKALLFSAILLASVLLLMLTEAKLLLVLNTKTPKNFVSRGVSETLETKEADYEETILLPSKYNMLKVKIDSIKLIKANDYYSNIVSESYSKSILSKYSLKKWEQLLPKKHFIRVHRSSIVNLNYVQTIDKMNNNTYKIEIKGYDKRIDMSRRYAKNILCELQL